MSQPDLAPRPPAPRVLRHDDADELVAEAASRLLDTLVDLQSSQETVHLCLTGGQLSLQVLGAFADLVPDSALEPSALHLWWTDEGFVPTTDPERNSIQSIGTLARTLPLSASQTHPMPASDGKADPAEAAFAYAAELDGTVFDICLLGMGADGHVAALFPGHPGLEGGTSTVVGVTDCPTGPPERTSLTPVAINRSQRVWLWAVGERRADAVARALAGDETLPAALVHGQRETLWFLDEAAAQELPQYRCAF